MEHPTKTELRATLDWFIAVVTYATNEERASMLPIIREKLNKQLDEYVSNNEGKNVWQKNK